MNDDDTLATIELIEPCDTASPHKIEKVLLNGGTVSVSHTEPKNKNRTKNKVNGLKLVRLHAIVSEERRGS